METCDRIQKLTNALRENADAFGVELSLATIELLARHFSLVEEANPILHLTGPSEPEEFAVRHVLESLFLLDHLRPNTRLTDIGPGGGFPSIPCVLARPDINGTLVESSAKKAAFLEKAAVDLNIEERVSVINKQFSELGFINGDVLTCRALDKFSLKLPDLFKRFRGKRFLLFGGDNLAATLDELKRPYEKKLIPCSEKRYLFIVDR